MGGSQSNCVRCPVDSYDVRKHQDQKYKHGAITPTPSVGDKMERFDSIATSRSTKTSSSGKNSQVTPYTQDPPVALNYDVDNNYFNSKINETDVTPTSRHPKLRLKIPNNTQHAKNSISVDDTILATSPEFEPKSCESISDMSDNLDDSDLGSDSLSNAQSSARSQNNNRGSKKDGERAADEEGTGRKVREVQPCGSISSEESLSYGTLKRNRGRSAFNASVLGRRDAVSITVTPDSLEAPPPVDVLYWRKGDRLGSGSFGTVWLGLTNTGELIAVKQMQLQASLSDFREAEKEYDKIYQEVVILQTLIHRNVVGYLGSCYDNGNVSIFMEYVAGGSLGAIIQKFGPLPENIVTRYTRQLLDAITYMHRNSVVHRDIKSANIMLTPDGTIKLIDFGCAKKLELRLSRSGSHLMKSLRGTPYWMAPEVINETGHGKKSDIWSLGCTVFEMLTGSPPWGDREPIAAIFAIGSEEFPIPKLPDTCSNYAQEFTAKCMLRDKHKRPPADRLLMHPFVASIPWEEEATTPGNNGGLFPTVTGNSSSRQTSIESSLSQYHGGGGGTTPSSAESTKVEL